MIKQSEINSKRIINITKTDLSIEEEFAVTNNYYYLDYIQGSNEIYLVLQDFNDEMTGVIYEYDAQVLVNSGFGYFRETKNSELIFVYTNTGNNNFKNYAIYELIANKDLFSDIVKNYYSLNIPITYNKEFSGVYIDTNNKKYLIATKEKTMDELIKNSGVILDRWYWYYYENPLILYKFK